ncbi:LysR family transcriptional regulator [Rhizobium panacihumi]|uniref:LysR family transcriptional regulator n=1 Tax=Rhizobium panacihumi TaxID=2008450 RepID=UPI003D7A7B1E
MKNNITTSDLKVFLAVIREGGFRAAAKQLGVAPSKVSTTVSRIETELGVPLLLRTTRSVRATEHGRLLAERVNPLLGAIDAACLETANATDRVQGSLKLNVPGSVMPDVLPPLIIAFQRAHPAVEVEIVVENSFVDIITAGCDAGIRYGSSIEKDMISIPIGPRAQQIALGASPSYLEANGWPQHPADLASHKAIRYRLPGGPLLPWDLQCAGETVRVKPESRLILSVNALNTGLIYARTGLGVIGAFRNWLEDDLRAGSLVPVLADWWAEQEGPRLYYPSRIASRPLRAFIDICQSETRTR